MENGVQSVSTLLSFSFIFLVAVMYSALILGCAYANNRSPNPSKLAVYILRMSIGGFLLVSGLLALQGFFLNFESMPPKFVFAVVPALLGAIYFAIHPRVGQWLRFFPQSALVMAQSFRIFVEVILYYLSMTPLLPKLMTFEGRNFDILVGLSAPVVAHFIHHAKTPKTQALMRKITVVWNIFGLILLVNVSVHGILSTPSAFRMIEVEPPNTVMGHFPFIWLPAFLVPVALLLHLLSLRKVWIDHKK